jgi:hypothetical protein
VIRTNTSTTANPTTTTNGDGAAPPRRRGRPPKPGPKAPPKPKTTRPGAGLSGSPEAKRKASLVLEVLGGLRTPTSASAVLGVSVQRYYMIEVRALQGLIAALDVKPKPGGQPSPETALRRVTAERDRLERDLLRAQALLRVAQRAVGLPPLVEPTLKTGKSGKAGKAGPGQRKTRTPTVRARRAADTLRESARADDAPAAPNATVDPTT